MSTDLDLEQVFSGFEYSDAQWSCIMSALSQFEPTAEAIRIFRFQLARSVNAEVIDDDSMLDAEQSVRREIENALAAIMMLEDTLGGRVVHDDEFEIEHDKIGAAYSDARPHLSRLSGLLRSDLKARTSSAIAPVRRPNNSRPFAKRLMQLSAEVWQRFGGTINHGVEFKTFFNSVVHPVLSDVDVIRLQKCAWSDGMFRNFVQEEMKRQGILGKRGPKAKTQF